MDIGFCSPSVVEIHLHSNTWRIPEITYGFDDLRKSPGSVDLDHVFEASYATMAMSARIHFHITGKENRRRSREKLVEMHIQSYPIPDKAL